MSLEKVVAKIQERFGPRVVVDEGKYEYLSVTAPANELRDLLAFLHGTAGCEFHHPMDLCGIDRGSSASPRFEVVYNLFSVPQNHRILVRVPVPDERHRLPTVSDLWHAADWFEREVWDMFGVSFDGHPRMERLFLVEEFVGHPLRKDYPIQKRQKMVRPREVL